VARRPYRAKAARIDGRHREIYGFENAPRAAVAASHEPLLATCIGIEPAASLLGDYSDGANVGGSVRQLELFRSSRDDLPGARRCERGGILTQRACDRRKRPTCSGWPHPVS